jgi:hypothetical protein
MTISNFTDLFATTTAPTGEALTELDATADKEFAAFLAAAYAPLPTPPVADSLAVALPEMPKMAEPPKPPKIEAAPPTKAVSAGERLFSSEQATAVRSGQAVLPSDWRLPLATKTTSSATPDARPALSAAASELEAPQAALTTAPAASLTTSTPMLETAAPPFAPSHNEVTASPLSFRPPVMSVNERAPQAIVPTTSAAAAPAASVATVAVAPTNVPPAPLDPAVTARAEPRSASSPFAVPVAGGNEIPMPNRSHDTSEVVSEVVIAARAFSKPTAIPAQPARVEADPVLLSSSAPPELPRAKQNNFAREASSLQALPTSQPEAAPHSLRLPPTASLAPPATEFVAEFKTSAPIVVQPVSPAARATTEDFALTFALPPALPTVTKPSAESVKLAARVVQTLVAAPPTEFPAPDATQQTAVPVTSAQFNESPHVSAALPTSSRSAPAVELPAAESAESFHPTQSEFSAAPQTVVARSTPVLTGLPSTFRATALPPEALAQSDIIPSSQVPRVVIKEETVKGMVMKDVVMADIGLKDMVMKAMLLREVALTESPAPVASPSLITAEPTASQILPARAPLPAQPESPEVFSARPAPIIAAERAPIATPPRDTQLPGVASLEPTPALPTAAGTSFVAAPPRPQSLPPQTALELQPEPSAVKPSGEELLFVDEAGLVAAQTLPPNQPLQPRAVNADNPQPIVNQTLEPLLEFAPGVQPRETRSLRLSLHPAELGRVDVEVARDAEGRVSAALTVEQADTAQALSQGIGQLREALERAGVVVERLHVGTSPQFQSNAHPQSGQQQHSHQTHASGTEYASLEPAVTEEAAPENRLLSLRA